MGIIEAILGVIAGGLGSWVGRIFGILEKQQSFAHELKLLEMQMALRQAETENELAIAQEAAYSTMREASYHHDISTTHTSLWVNNLLRLVRPLLTLLLILLVWAIWHTIAPTNHYLQQEIANGILFMASAALAWWFGDRAPQKKLPWE